MSREAMKLALDALESCGAGHISDGGNQWYDEKLVDKAITALQEALAEDVPETNFGNTALDKMAENARELGLDYKPQRWAVFCQGCRKEWTVSYPHPGKSICADCDDKPAQQEPVAWMFQHDETGRMNYVSNDGIHNPTMFLEMNPRYALVCPLYTSSPAQRKPLTDMQVDGEWILVRDLDTNDVEKSRLFARAIEAAHGIKENT